ncbi:hypothetical protein IMY05_018G0057800 [Salix suchowensis]|nr:hypothetical protein IMY05_018G0057800 [Salix suchowensis]
MRCCYTSTIKCRSSLPHPTFILHLHSPELANQPPPPPTLDLQSCHTRGLIKPRTELSVSDLVDFAALPAAAHPGLQALATSRTT